MEIGVLHVRRSILIQAPPERVWQEFETQERVKGWLNLGHQIHKFEPRLGGLVEMSVEVGGELRFCGGHQASESVASDCRWLAPGNRRVGRIIVLTSGGSAAGEKAAQPGTSRA